MRQVKKKKGILCSTNSSQEWPKERSTSEGDTYGNTNKGRLSQSLFLREGFSTTAKGNRSRKKNMKKKNIRRTHNQFSGAGKGDVNSGGRDKRTYRRRKTVS